MKSLMLNIIVTVQILSIFTVHTQQPTRATESFILNHEQQPSPLLLQLLETENIQHDGTLASIVSATQIQWLQRIRPPGTERWQIDQNIIDEYEAKAATLMPFFIQFGFVHEQKPTQPQYDYAVLLGSTMSQFCKRLHYLKQVYDQGIRFNKLIILTGERTLELKENNEQLQKCLATLNTINEVSELKETLRTETDMVFAVLKHAKLPWQIPTEIIHAPANYKEGKVMRPTTSDTVHEWLKSNPTPGSVLAVSTQPYCPYQDIVLKKLLPKDFIVETIANKVGKSKKVVVYIDTLLRYLWVARNY